MASAKEETNISLLLFLPSLVHFVAKMEFLSRRTHNPAYKIEISGILNLTGVKKQSV